MAGRKGGFYAVQSGRRQGVFDTWDDCKAQISGYSGARYKKFDTLSEAQAFSEGQSWSGTSQRGVSDYGTGFANPSRRSEPYPAPSYSVNKPRASNRVGGRSFYSVKSSNPSIASRIFDNWKDCERYVKGQKGMSFKKFQDKTSAVQFMNGSADDQVDFRLAGVSKDDFKAKFKLSAANGKYHETSRVYCDGSALANGTRASCAGYGVHFADEPGNDISEPLKSGAQTNNRAEIQAVSSALDKIWHNLTENDDKKCYEIKTDSEYVAKLLNDRYFAYTDDELKKLPNNDLIQPLLSKYTKVKQYYQTNRDHFGNNGRFDIIWVKGHSGEPGNEKADELAKAGALNR